MSHRISVPTSEHRRQQDRVVVLLKQLGMARLSEFNTAGVTTVSTQLMAP